MSQVSVPSIATFSKRAYHDFLCSKTPHDAVVSLGETWGAAKAREAAETSVVRVRKEETILQRLKCKEICSNALIIGG
jgi:hypothetical protein